MHAHITQTYQTVEIHIAGRLKGRGAAQLGAIVEHFARRGCKIIRVYYAAKQARLQDEAEIALEQARDLITTIAIRQP